MRKILLVEDEPDIRQLLKRYLVRNGYSVDDEDCVARAKTRLTSQRYDLLISDLRLNDGSGTELMNYAHGAPVIIVSAYPIAPSEVHAIMKGAADCMAKPIDFRDLSSRIAELVPVKATSQGRDADSAECGGRLLGDSPPMRRLFSNMSGFAAMNWSLLIRGESGTGKELVAHEIHRRSKRASGPFVPLNCAALPAGLIEDELFGHVKGAFPDARVARQGLFEEAHGGSLFLDEIAELSKKAQAKLLRVLETGEVRRLGGNDLRMVDVRIIAATHQNLELMMQRGDFREDLYFRLSTLELMIPPLRERLEDLELLVPHLLARACRENGMPCASCTPETIEKLRQHSWRGNVRELKNVLCILNGSVIFVVYCRMFCRKSPAFQVEPFPSSRADLPVLVFLCNSPARKSARDFTRSAWRMVRTLAGRLSSLPSAERQPPRSRNHSGALTSAAFPF